MLTLVVVVNKTIEKRNSTQLVEKLNNAGLKSAEGSLSDRYLKQFITTKEKKCQVGVNHFYCFIWNAEWKKSMS